MALRKCPHCKTYVRENRSVCSDCGRELLGDDSGEGLQPAYTWESEDEGDETLGPINRAGQVLQAREVDDPPIRRSRSSALRDEESDERRPESPRESSTPASSFRPGGSQRFSSSRPRRFSPAPRPILAPREESSSAPSPVAQRQEGPDLFVGPRVAPDREPRSVRAFLIRMLGGAPAVLVAPIANPRPEPPEVPEPLHPIIPIGSAGSGVAWSDAPAPELTVAAIGHEIAELHRPHYVLQLLDSGGKWCDYAPIYPKGRTVGSKLVGTLAPRHFGLGFAKDRLCVREIESLNGVFLRITQPVRLDPGARFRIGDYLLEYRDPEPHEEVQPQRSGYGERLCCRDIRVLGWLAMIRPDGQTGHSFPITAATVFLGRAPTVESGTAQAIVLPDEESTISRTHARLDLQEGRFLLKDQGTGLGTYVKVDGTHPLNPGDEFLAADARFRVEARASR